MTKESGMTLDVLSYIPLCHTDVTEVSEHHSQIKNDNKPTNRYKFLGEKKKLRYPALLALMNTPCIQASDLVITEIMQNPSVVLDDDGEWFEVLNTGDTDINLNSWTVSDNDNDSFVIDQDVIVKAGYYAVLSNNSDITTNGGVTVAYEYSGMFLSNGSDELVLTSSDSTEIDRVEWDNGSTFPDPTGASMVLDNITADNNVGTNWSESTDIFGDGDSGTPNSGPDGQSSGGDDDGDGDGGDDSDSGSSTDSVFISEYIEGSSNNKAIELYNPTGADIDLAAGNYQLGRFSNGGASPTLIDLIGTLEAGGVFVIANSSSVSDILNVADQTSGNINHNGDDAYELYADGVVIDSFGQVGFDPGSEWGTSPNDTQNNTLIRNDDVYTGDTDSSDEFEPSVEWTGLGQDVFTDLGSHTVAAREIFISEYIEGSSNNKAIELYNPSSADIDLAAGNYQLGRFSNGGTNATLIDLTGTIPAKGVYVVANSSATQDILDVTDQTSGNINHNGDDAYELYADSVVIDSFGQVGFDPGSEWGTGDQSTQNNTLVRKETIASGDTDSSDEFDPSIEWDGYASDTYTYLGSHTVSDGGDGSGDDVVIGACFDTATEGFAYISAVQGSGSASPFDDQAVIVEGVVTALRNSGYFLQEELVDEDADFTTSEGIFVYHSTDFPEVGDIVRVAGTADEYYDMTQLTSVTEQIVCEGNASVSTVSVILPLVEGDDLEYYEGMMVSVTDLVVFDTDGLWQYGELGLSHELKKQPTDLYAPLSAEYEQQIIDNESNIIYVEDDNATSYPDALSFYPAFSYANPIRVTDTVSATGPLNYSYSKYRVNPIDGISLVSEREAAPDLVKGDVTIATFNVLNYFNGEADGEGGITFDYDANRGAESLEEFELQEARIVEAIVAMDADVIGLMEIENDGFDADSAIQSLVSAVNALQSEENEYSFVATADESLVGTDAIAVGLIYRASVVTPSNDAIKIDMPSQLQEGGVSYQQMRVSLLQSFSHDESGEELAAVVNHFKSKGSGCYEDAVDTSDLDTIQGSCNALRVSAAVTLGDALEAADLPERVMILGDLNAYSAEDPVAVLTDYTPEERGYTITTAINTELDDGEAVAVTDTYGFENVAETFDADGFSYWYYGTMQVGSLDHVLASPAFMEDIVDATHWSINSVEVYQLQYDQALAYYRDEDGYAFTDIGPYRSSDHDPFIVSVTFASESVTGDWDTDGDVDVNDVRGLIVAIQQGQVIDMVFDLNEDGVINVLDARTMMTLCTRTRCAAE